MTQRRQFPKIKSSRGVKFTLKPLNIAIASNYTRVGQRGQHKITLTMIDFDEDPILLSELCDEFSKMAP